MPLPRVLTQARAARAADYLNRPACGGEDSGKLSALKMGSGDFAAGAFAKSAYQHAAFDIDTKVVSQWLTWTTR